MPPTLPPPSGEAFALVRKLLSSRPKLFQEILQEGIAAHPSSANPRQPKPARQPRRLASGRYAQEASETYLPEGHPFVSASYLKHRILPTLASQYLVQKTTAQRASWPADSDVPPANRTGWVWSLMSDQPSSSSTPAAPASGEPASSASSSSSTSSSISALANMTPWDREAHWARLEAGESPSVLGHEKISHHREVKAAKKEARFDSGKARRTERETMAWQGRQEGLTTRLERLHLNTRRQEARPAKERKTWSDRLDSGRSGGERKKTFGLL